MSNLSQTYVKLMSNLCQTYVEVKLMSNLCPTDNLSSTFQVLHSRVGSLPHPQTLDKTVKACQGQTL
jgi:hypothetical protein